MYAPVHPYEYVCLYACMFYSNSIQNLLTDARACDLYKDVSDEVEVALLSLGL